MQLLPPAPGLAAKAIERFVDFHSESLGEHAFCLLDHDPGSERAAPTRLIARWRSKRVAANRVVGVSGPTRTSSRRRGRRISLPADRGPARARSPLPARSRSRGSVEIELAGESENRCSAPEPVKGEREVVGQGHQAAPSRSPASGRRRGPRLRSFSASAAALPKPAASPPTAGSVMSIAASVQGVLVTAMSLAPAV